jgi:hypothetical protein
MPDPSPGRTWGELQIGFFLIVIPILRFLLFRWLFLFIQQHLFCSGKNGNL